jgi:acetyl-CoA carboxylase biotin carboxyl carrier protein
MFTFDELCELIRLVSETRVGGFEIERDGVRVRIDGVPAAAQSDMGDGTSLLPLNMAALRSPTATAAATATAASPSSESDPAEDGLSFVTSPIVGTFYVAPAPDAASYVKIGDTVHKGQVVCIVEAMKLMNEIEADVSGVVVKVFVDNAQPVEFGQRLFAIRLH